MRTKCRFYSLNKKRQCCLDSHHSLIIDFITTNGKQKDCERPRANENMGSGERRQPAEKLCLTDVQRDHLRFLGKQGFGAREREGDDSRNHTAYVCETVGEKIHKNSAKQKRKIPPSKELSMTQTMESATTSISKAFLGSKPRAFTEES